MEKDSNCMDVIKTCIEGFSPNDFDDQHIVSNVELLKYKKMEGIFGRKLAIMGNKSFYSLLL